MEIAMSRDIAGAEHSSVRLDRLFPRLADIAWKTSLQALLLALRLMRRQRAHVEDVEGPDSGFELESYFGGLRMAPAVPTELRARP